MGAFARVDRKQLGLIKRFYGEGVLLHVYTKDSKGNYVRYLDIKQQNKRVNGLYIGYGYLLSGMEGR